MCHLSKSGIRSTALMKTLHAGPVCYIQIIQYRTRWKSQMIFPSVPSKILRSHTWTEVVGSQWQGFPFKFLKVFKVWINCICLPSCFLEYSLLAFFYHLLNGVLCSHWIHLSMLYHLVEVSNDTSVCRSSSRLLVQVKMAV